jgi:hypothetical protein
MGCALVFGAGTARLARNHIGGGYAGSRHRQILREITARFESRSAALMASDAMAIDLAHIAHGGNATVVARAAQALSASARTARPTRRPWLEEGTWRVRRIDATDRCANGEAHPGEIAFYLLRAGRRCGWQATSSVAWIPWDLVVRDACAQLDERWDRGHAVLAGLDRGVMGFARLRDLTSSLSLHLAENGAVGLPCWGFHEMAALLAAAERLPDCAGRFRDAACAALASRIQGLDSDGDLWPRGLGPEGPRAMLFLGHLLELMTDPTARLCLSRLVSRGRVQRSVDSCWMRFGGDAEYVNAGPFAHFVRGVYAWNDLLLSGDGDWPAPEILAQVR